jgi:acetyl-CoA carboxylase biotin carboxylase subunit
LPKKLDIRLSLKATAGGGGKGMRIVNSDDKFKSAWDSCKMEAGAAFGNESLYLEKFIVGPRHVEIQVIGDRYGKVCHFRSGTVPFNADTRN